jgi:glycosyltransferase involved in cell wall biosynthesis
MLRFLSWEQRDPGARVLQVTNMWPVEADPAGPAGSPGPRYGIFVKRQVDSLIEAGVRCDVLLVRGFESRLAYVIAAFFLLVSGLTRRRYRLVHVHAGETAFAARFYLTAPVIVTYYGDDLLGTPRADGSIPLHMRLRRAVQRAHARLATRTITQSREMERVLPASVQRRNLVIPSGVDPDLFRPIDRHAARQRLGWQPDERVALFAADPGNPRKRHWLAQAACEWAGEHVERVRLQVAADVAPDDIPLLMSAADCLVLTSSIEGSPNVVKEAILCNLPVATTRVGDVEEVLAGVEPSWFCDANSGAIGAALVECLREPRRSNGREASAWLSSETIARSHLDLYEELAPGSAST